MRASSLLPALVAVAALAVPHATFAEDAPVPGAPAEVRIERAKPMKDKYPTLRFLRENRDFIRGRFDRLRERPLERHGDATAIDPRFLAYRELLAALDRSRDSLAGAEDARAREALFASVTQLGSLESELDQLERGLGEQRGRLAVIEKDFTGDQATEMLVVLSGFPTAADLAAVSLELEDGGTLSIPLSADQRAALRSGGMVEILHAFVEPRAQLLRVGIAGTTWPAGDTGWLELDPARDRLNLLRLDLSGLGPATGAPGIRASTWIHRGSTLTIDG